MVQITSNKFQIKGFAESRQGGRDENQDDWGFVETPLGFLVIVCDGMGGGPGGKTASAVAKTEIIRCLLQTSPQVPVAEAIGRAVQKADAALKMRMQQNPRLAGMGTTFVALLLNANAAYVAHAGDSRCYRLQGEKVMFRTADHSLVGELVRSKALTEEQARTSPQSNLITRGLGSVGNTLPEVEVVPYRSDNRFVLCTDGVWGMMNQTELVAKLCALNNLAIDVPRLSDEIDRLGFVQGGHHDNHTLVVVDVATHSLLKDSRLNVALPNVFCKSKRAKWLVVITLCLVLGVGLVVYRGLKVNEGASVPCVVAKNSGQPADTATTTPATVVTSTAVQWELSEQEKLLNKLIQRVEQLFGLKCDSEEEAVERATEMVKMIDQELNKFQHVSDSLNERSLYSRLKIRELRSFFAKNQAQVERVMMKEKTKCFVPSYQAQQIILNLRQQLLMIAEEKSTESNA